MYTCTVVVFVLHWNSAGESEAAVSSMAEDIVNVVAFYCERRQVRSYCYLTIGYSLMQ
jgi:hypothetical protein